MNHFLFAGSFHVMVLSLHYVTKTTKCLFTSETFLIIGLSFLIYHLFDKNDTIKLERQRDTILRLPDPIPFMNYRTFKSIYTVTICLLDCILIYTGFKCFGKATLIPKILLIFTILILETFCFWDSSDYFWFFSFISMLSLSLQLCSNELTYDRFYFTVEAEGGYYNINEKFTRLNDGDQYFYLFIFFFFVKMGISKLMNYEYSRNLLYFCTSFCNEPNCYQDVNYELNKPSPLLDPFYYGISMLIGSLLTTFIDRDSNLLDSFGPDTLSACCLFSISIFILITITLRDVKYTRKQYRVFVDEVENAFRRFNAEVNFENRVINEGTSFQMVYPLITIILAILCFFFDMNCLGELNQKYEKNLFDKIFALTRLDYCYNHLFLYLYLSLFLVSIVFYKRFLDMK